MSIRSSVSGFAAIVSAFGPVLEHRDEIQTDQMRDALLFPSRRLAAHLAAQGVRDLQFERLASGKQWFSLSASRSSKQIGRNRGGAEW